MRNTFADVQIQPQLCTTFDPTTSYPVDAHSYSKPSLNLAHGRQIRVLVLKAGRLGDPLQCDLEHVNLQQGPSYEALSYTWANSKGDDSSSQTILCGPHKHTIGITKNCEAALLLVRNKKTDRRLWVDAVCIDQSNILERNHHQVKNMIATFHSAIRALVYLGQGNLVLSRLIDYFFYMGC